MTPPLTLILTGATLGEIIERMRFLLDTVRTDEGAALLAAMDAPLPPAMKRRPEGAITAAQIDAALDGQAPAVDPDTVRAKMREYVARFGDEAAMKHLPKLLGAPRVSDVMPEHLWRALDNLEGAIATGKPAGRKSRKEN